MLIEVSRWVQYARLQPLGFRALNMPLGRGTARVYIGGRGPDLLVLHGAQGGAMEHTGWMLPELAKYYRVIAPDIPGMAESRSVLEPHEASIHTIAELLHTMLDRLGVSKPLRLAGGSMGGWIAMRMVLQQPERFQRMVLACPGGLPTHLSLDDAAAAVVPETIEQLVYGARFMMRRPLRLPRMLLADMLATFRANNAALRAALKDDYHLTEDELRSITIPTLIAWGECDNLLPVENGRYMASVMPNARLVVVPDCGHSFILEAPEFTLAATLAGLREPGEAAPRAVPQVRHSASRQLAERMQV